MSDKPIHELAVRCPACKAVVGIDLLTVVDSGRPTATVTDMPTQPIPLPPDVGPPGKKSKEAP